MIRAKAPGFVVTGVVRRERNLPTITKKLSRKFHDRAAAEAFLKMVRKQPGFEKDYADAYVTEV